jgi:hypothetical protein
MKMLHSLRDHSLVRILQHFGLRAASLAIISTLIAPVVEREADAAPAVPDNAFPACIQFSPVPAGKGWKGEKPPVSAEVQQDTLQNLIDHGFSVLYYPVGGLSDAQNQEVMALAQSLVLLC